MYKTAATMKHYYRHTWVFSVQLHIFIIYYCIALQNNGYQSLQQLQVSDICRNINTKPPSCFAIEIRFFRLQLCICLVPHFLFAIATEQTKLTLIAKQYICRFVLLISLAHFSRRIWCGIRNHLKIFTYVSKCILML